MSYPLPEATPEQLSLARKMAREGLSVAAIHAALGLPCTVKHARVWLRRHGIKPSVRRLAHLGADTSLSNRDSVDFRDYRPGNGRAGP